MSTSNRLARAADRARELAREIEGADSGADSAEMTRRMQELTVTDHRAMLLLKVLQSFYVALGGFALATLLSLVGAVLASVNPGLLVRTLEVLAVTSGGIAVGSLVRGSVLLVRETNMAVRVMHERAAGIRRRIGG